MYDYQIVCLNGANRTKDQETTDATVVHPITKKCEQFISEFCNKNNIVCLGGVAFSGGLLTNLIDALEENNFKENWTLFSDGYNSQLINLQQCN